MKIVEHTINIILQHYDRPTHHSKKTIIEYENENGYSLYYKKKKKKIQNSSNKCKTTWAIIRKLNYYLELQKS
jgi:hypothetical protein